jgi:hypothetical protein
MFRRLTLATGVCALALVLFGPLRSSIEPRLTFFLDSQVVYAPGMYEPTAVQPDMCCQPPPPPPAESVSADYETEVKLDDEYSWVCLAGNCGNPPKNYSCQSWTCGPTDTEVLIDNAGAAMVATTAQQLSRNAADQIGGAIASKATGTTQGTIFSGLMSTTSYGLRWATGKISVM